MKLDLNLRLTFFLLVCIGMFNSCKESTPFEERILLTYFDPAVSNFPTGDPLMAATNVREQAMRLYKDGNYEQAIVLFDEVFQDSPSDQDRGMWLYYKANAQLALRKIDPAQQTLRYIPQSYSRYPTVEWLMALVYVRKGDREKAKKLLEQLQANPKFQTQATEILEQL